jgi:hypothetical protein
MLTAQLTLLTVLMHDAAATRVENSTARVVVDPPSVHARTNMILTAWPAPVGHRQPRPADIPAEGQKKRDFDWQLERLNKAIDDKLRICRGC